MKTHIPEYKKVARTVAKNTGAIFVDLGSMVEEFMNTVGEKQALTYYMVLPQGKYESYPDGRDDTTHYNRKGAKLVSQMIAVALQENKQVPKKIRRAITAPSDYYKGTTVNVSKTVVTKKGTRYQLKWKKINPAKRYEIYRYDASKKKYKKVVSTNNTSYILSRKWTKQQVKKMKVKAVLGR